ncbi:MAG: peptide deformylase [bacterium]
MAIYRIYTYPEKVLKHKAKEIKNINGKLQEFIDNMYETMHYASGIGLAATQVGEEISLFVADVPITDEKTQRVTIINPVIVESEGESAMEEGCLSVPNFRIKVKRAGRIVVKGYDREGRDLVLEADGLLATVIQHEIDHLNGITLLDKASLLKREAYLKSLLEKH